MRESDRIRDSGSERSEQPSHGRPERREVPEGSHERGSLENRGGDAPGAERMDRGTSLSDSYSGWLGSSNLTVSAGGRGGGSGGLPPPKDPEQQLKEWEADWKKRNAEAEGEEAKRRKLASRRIG